MSVQSQINRITAAVASAYDAVDDIGGTLPASETVGNLASAISSCADSVTENYTNVSSASTKTKVLHGSSYYQKIVPDDGYLISSVTVTMGGVDITSQVFSGDTGTGGGTTPTGTLSIVQNGTYDVTNYASAEVDVPSSGIVPTGTVSITQNGTVNVTNYASASVSVPNTYSSSDEGKVVDGGALVAQTSDTVTENGTYDTTTVSSLTVNVSGGGGVVLSGMAQSVIFKNGRSSTIAIIRPTYKSATVMGFARSNVAKGSTLTVTNMLTDGTHVFFNSSAGSTITYNGSTATFSKNGTDFILTIPDGFDGTIPFVIT